MPLGGRIPTFPCAAKGGLALTPRALVVIPAYNEGDSIAEVLLDLRRAAPGLDRLVVDDGSRDGTRRVVASLGERQLSFACNLGYGHALQAGLRYAVAREYDLVVFFDADGQHRAEDAVRVVATLLETGADVAVGSRFCGGRPYTGPFGRRLGQRLLSYLSRLVLGQRVYDTTSGLKAVRAAAFPALMTGTFMDFHIEALLELTLRGFSIVEVPITVRERERGRSMYSTMSAIAYPAKTLFLTLVTAVSIGLQRREQ